MTTTFRKRSPMPVSAQELHDWHARLGALERLTPPWSTVEVLERSGDIADGRVVLRMPLGPFKVRWVAQHFDYVPGRQFRDRQEEGPFASWVHTHRFEPDGPNRSFLEDEIEYAPPLGPLGAVIAGPFLGAMLEQMFRYRHAVTAQDLEAHAAVPGEPLKVLVSGATGLVGSNLIPFLATGGHHVSRLVRRAPTGSDVLWDPATGKLDPADLDGFDAVVHLAGENIAGGRWNDELKRRVLDSRVAGTRLLSNALAKCRRKPAVFVSASAIGFYGNRGSEELVESSPAGEGFLGDVCRAWEAETAPAEAAGIRVVHHRIGIVLTPAGGALAQMLLPFKFGLGGRVGSGTQYMSWISLDDLLGTILHSIRTEALRGAVNAVAPAPATNAEFTHELGSVLHRPTVLPVPGAALKMAFGEMADALLLGGARVLPKRLIESGYRFRHPTLESALRHVLGR